MWAVVFAAAAAVPQVQWSQSKDRLTVGIIVKNLDKDSVAADFTEDGFTFTAEDKSGALQDFTLRLRDDISGGSWTIPGRKVRLMFCCPTVIP